MFYRPSGSVIHTLSRPLIEKIVHHTVNDYIPRPLRDRTLTKMEAISMVFFLLNLSTSASWRLIASFLGVSPRRLFLSTLGKQFNGMFIQSVFDAGGHAFQPPYARPWIKRLALIDWLDATVVKTTLQTECLEQLPTKRLTLPLNLVRQEELSEHDH